MPRMPSFALDERRVKLSQAFNSIVGPGRTTDINDAAAKSVRDAFTENRPWQGEKEGEREGSRW